MKRLAKITVLSDQEKLIFDSDKRPQITPKNPNPYDILLLKNLGFDIEVPIFSLSTRWLKIRDVIEHRLGINFFQTLMSSRRIANSEIAIAVLEHNADFFLKMRSYGVFPFKKTSLVVFACWLTESLSKLEGRPLARKVRLLNHADLITVLSENQVAQLVYLGIKASKIVSLNFGVNGDYFRPVESNRDIDILSVGQDAGRDFETLIQAVEGTELFLNLVCKQSNLPDRPLPLNVKHFNTVPKSEYLSLLGRAKVVVVPTKVLAYPTGQSVAMEAALAGAAVIVTNTVAMSQYFTDGATALMPEVGDPESLRGSIRALLASEDFRLKLAKNGQANVSENFTEGHMWNQLAPHLDDLARKHSRRF